MTHKHKTPKQLFEQGDDGLTKDFRGMPVKGCRVLRQNARSGPFMACPRCGSDEIEGSAWDGEGFEVWQDITCGPCKFQWKEVYLYSFAEAEENQE